MFIDFATPFADQFLFVLEELRNSPTFTPKHSYLAEIKKVVIPVAPACEGVQCNRCHSPLLIHNPLQTYDCDLHTCEDDEVDEVDEVDEEYEQTMAELEEQAFDDYIDYMLDAYEYN